MSSLPVVPRSARKRLQNLDDRSKGIQKYDIDNKYPQAVLYSIASSGTASACQDEMRKFLRGNGFSNLDLENLIVNADGDTLATIHDKVCDTRATFRGYYLHIGYNGLLEANSIRVIPFEQVRLLLTDDSGACAGVKVYPDWDGSSGKKYNPELMTEIDFFTTDKEKIAAQIQRAGGFSNWKGHVLMISDAGKHVYPTAVVDPVLEDVNTESAIKKFNNRTVINGFTDKTVVIYKGKIPTDDVRNDEGVIIGQREQRDFLANYTDSLSDFVGEENAGGLLTIHAEREEDVPTFKPLETPKDEKRYDWTMSTAMESIIRCYRQPLALQAIKTAGQLGMQKEFEEAKKLYDERLAELRNRIALSFKQILDIWHDSAYHNIEDYSIIPLTGISEKPKAASYAERLDVGTFTSMQTMLQSALTDEQKTSQLVILFGLNPNDAQALVSGTIPPQYAVS